MIRTEIPQDPKWSINLSLPIKSAKTNCDESEVGNVLNFKFNQDRELKIVVDNLIYIGVEQKSHYICVLVDLYSRGIFGIALVHKRLQL